VGVVRKMFGSPARAVPVAFLLSAACAAQAADGDDGEIAEITVTESRVANTRPAGTFAAPATALRYDPTTELQSRGLPEGQADVTVRGGLFENTGFRVGVVTIMDPQTGHYAAELPLDPALLSTPEILTGIDNTLAGFNSNIATVMYAPRLIADGGQLLAGAGSDGLDFQSVRWADASVTGDWGVALSAARSGGDGSVDNGDHEFERYNVQLQRRDGDSQTDLLIGYQDKFYGWPGAYTGFASLAETDHTKTTLALASHRAESAAGWWELGGFYRRLVDDYDFDRTTSESGAPGSFDHETRVYGLGFEGVFRRSAVDWHVAGQLTADELVSSTDLVAGDFDDRNYGTFSIAPTFETTSDGGMRRRYRAGVDVDWSNRDDTAVSPVIGAEFERPAGAGTVFVSLEYAGSSQLPGYTALKSPPSGLFGGNAALGRERARQLEVSVGRWDPDWSTTVSLFVRRDDKLVDWTYASGAPFARQANAVDLDVVGVEALFTRTWDAVDIVAGYTFLDKDADYGSAVVDASFYALNFARHRATLAVSYRIAESLELRIDSEYRRQEENPLRSSDAEALNVSASIAWEPSGGFGAALAADNLTDDDYEQFPGTPALGRQVSLSAWYAW